MSTQEKKPLLYSVESSDCSTQVERKGGVRKESTFSIFLFFLGIGRNELGVGFNLGQVKDIFSPKKRPRYILAGDSSERDVRHSSIHTQSPLPF